MSWFLFDLSDEASIRSDRFGFDVTSCNGFKRSPKGGPWVFPIANFFIWLSSAAPSKMLGCGGQPDAKPGEGDARCQDSVGSSLGNVPAF